MIAVGRHPRFMNVDTAAAHKQAVHLLLPGRFGSILAFAFERWNQGILTSL